MSKSIDLIGQSFTKLLVIEKLHNFNTRKYRWLCQCTCGQTTIVDTYYLLNGRTKNCGGKRKNMKKHGMTNTKVHHTWRHMLARCSNPKHKHYHRYGGRGIEVCVEWKDFNQFYADMGDQPLGLTLDRINNDGHYSKSNCRWATQIEQQRNRSDNVNITFQNQTLCISAWAEVTGISKQAIRLRNKKGWSLNKIFKEYLASSEAV
jgi:hypothetical protein